MAWDERQVRMLRAMGLRVWLPPELEAVEAAVAASRAAPVSAVVDATGLAAPVSAASSQRASPPAWPLRREAFAGAAAAPAPAAASANLSFGTSAQAVALQALTQLDWPALRQAVRNCVACEMASSRTQPVVGTGHAQAHWLVVGEAPDAEEEALGEPFVGPAGQLLDAMLQALGLSRQPDGDPRRSAYLVNALKCRPPASRNPRDDELKRCEPFLQRQIELLQPRVLLAMGRPAAQALLRSDAPLGQLRGRVHRFGGLPLVVTYAPSYLLRNAGDKAKAWADLCLAAAAVAAASGDA